MLFRWGGSGSDFPRVALMGHGTDGTDAIINAFVRGEIGWCNGYSRNISIQTWTLRLCLAEERCN